MTLFERITMSTESLAEFILRVENGENISIKYCKGDCNSDDCPHDVRCVVNWLNQPEQEENHD